MSVDYKSLRAENVIHYGTHIGRIGGMLLANRYDKRTHFIYELLQNAEDALRRRQGWKGSRSVSFHLSPTELRISHYGQAFDEPDVRGICGIDESTKDITAIGRFGIGFKSVYAFTERPEVHSGGEAFAIEDYVLPVAVSPRTRKRDETVIVLPLDEGDPEAYAEIVEGLQNLGARTLLFLRNVKEISWTVEGGPSGLYFRDDPIPHDSHVRELMLMGQQEGKEEIEERWLVFSREVQNEGKPVGYAEVAFSLSTDEKNPKKTAVQPIAESPLVVFFPTVLATHVGFLIQGPYRTTPSRDNVPPNDHWNRRLVRETSGLLIEALKWLSARKRLDSGVLRCLPMERSKFSGGLFLPLFDRVVSALKSDALLPCSDGEYASAANVRLSRTQDLRDLFQPDQLASLLESDAPIKWLSADITADRTPALRHYLIHELGLSEQTPETLLSRLDKDFLEAQTDDWIVRLYGFLGNVPALVAQLDHLPLVRLEDGTHVEAFIMGQPQAFLPTKAETEFPTVRRSVCARPQAKKFLQSLNLTEPDPVDDVIRNVVPKYQSWKKKPGLENYAADIARILHAFRTDSAAQKEKLLSSLKLSCFVKVKDAGDESSSLQYAELIYLATARLKELFAGVSGVKIVDDSEECLRGEDARELLEACGATRHLSPAKVDTTLSDAQKYQLRLEKGHVSATWEKPVEDYGIRGLPGLIKLLPKLKPKERATKARLLWEALIELEDRRGQSVFSGTYRWQYHQWRSASFDSHFIQHLNEATWIPGADGELQPPSAVVFESLGWPADPFIKSKIRFKKPIVEELAKEAGIEPGLLDMLKKLGLTSTARLMARLNVEGLIAGNGSGGVAEPAEGTANDNTGEAPEEEPENGEDEQDQSPTSARGAGGSDGASGADRGEPTEGEGTSDRSPRDRSQKSSSRLEHNSAERRFISYVAAHPEDGDEDQDPDSLSHAERLALEDHAIELIRSHEPLLKVMPEGNKGFDLIETDANDEPERWIEVKAMTGCLEDRPVGLSSVQFEFARRHGEQYWLYVVEHAGDLDRSRIIKIQNPAGRAGTFTFDKGWVAVAVIEEPLERAS